MTITATCKKIMALVLCCALMLTALVIPNKASADSTDPSATVLGTSLKIDNETANTQALRIAIKVSNANAAKACAITLQYNDKSYTVGTKPVEAGVIDRQISTLYSKDTDDNSVIYAVFLSNIPNSLFDSDFTITGKVWGIDNTVYSSAPVVRTINNTAASIAAAFPALNIVLKDDGILYKNGGDDALTKDDLAAQVQPTEAPQPTEEPTAQPVTDTELNPDNLVTNGNFANGMTGWTRDNCTITAEVVDNTNCALVSGRGNNYAAIISDLTGPFLPGDILEYQFKVKRTAAINKRFEVCLKYDGTGDDNIPTSTNAAGGNLYGSTDSWMTVTGTFTVGKSASTIRAYFRENGWKDYNAEGVVKSDYNFYIDDVEFVRTFAATPTPEPAEDAKTYYRVDNLSELNNGDKVLMIFNGDTDLFMLPEKKEYNSRIGFNVEDIGTLSLDDTITGKYRSKEWTFTKSGDDWLVGKGGKNIKLTGTSSNGVTATLESEGSAFTISGSSGSYNFISGDNALNYNTTRDLINGFAKGQNPAPFYLYRSDNGWNDNYEIQAKYDLWTPSGTDDAGMLGKEVIFVATDESGKAYAMSADGSSITATEITDMYFDDTLYIPASYNLNNISWSTMWNKAESSSTPDSGKGYMFQNMEDHTYLGIWGVEVSSQGKPDGYTTNQIDYKVRFTWSSTLFANYKKTNFLNYDGTGFDADSTSGTNVMCYVKSYAGDYARKNTWHQVDHLTSGCEYLMVNSVTPGTVQAFNMTGTGNSSFATKDVTVNNDGTITYTADYNDSAVINAHGLSDGTFYLDTWYCPTERHTLSYRESTGTKLYITSEHSLQNYTFRFVYEGGVLKGYYGLSGTDTEKDIKYAGGDTCFGTTGSDVYLFERDL